MGRWNKALGADSTTDDAAVQSGGDKDEHPRTNGVHKEDKEVGEEKKDEDGPDADAAQATTQQTPVEGKEESIDKIVDGDAPSGEIGQEGENAGEEVRTDAEVEAEASETS